jgi:hypothetical protein
MVIPPGFQYLLECEKKYNIAIVGEFMELESHFGIIEIPLSVGPVRYDIILKYRLRCGYLPV